MSGRPPKLTYEQEEEILNEFKDKAEAGQMIEVSEIKAAYEKSAGKSKSHGQIYRVLHRHGWRKIKPRSRHPKKASPEAIEASKKIKVSVEKARNFHKKSTGCIRLMFQDEAGFGRINKPKYCRCKKGIRPTVPCHHVREYWYVYGAVEPATGESSFLICPSCDTECMNLFLENLSKQFSDDHILLVCDGAGWHDSKTMIVPNNIEILHIPPYTPEMNPIEQICKELREKGFRNECFFLLIKLLTDFALSSKIFLLILL